MNRSIVTQAARAAALALAIGAVTPAFAGTAMYSQDNSAIFALKLNGGKKWQTDAPLRKAMSDVRDALAAEKDVLLAGSINPAKYEALALTIDAKTAYVIQNCALPPDVDAQLHHVLTQLLQGSAAMKGQDPNLSRRAGAEKAVAALDAYGRYFDHPGWTTLVSGGR